MHNTRTALRITTAWTVITVTVTLQVYDCNGHGAKYEMISLVRPSRCPNPKRDYREPVIETVQLLQRREYCIGTQACKNPVSGLGGC